MELQNEVECFMLRMAAIFPQRKEQLIYLINNYDLILGILQERTRDNTKEAESFREQLSARSNEYVEEILSPHIGGIIHFIKECEKENSDDLRRHDRRALALVQNFSLIIHCFITDYSLLQQIPLDYGWNQKIQE
jgi:hypothetical protein